MLRWAPATQQHESIARTAKSLLRGGPEVVGEQQGGRGTSDVTLLVSCACLIFILLSHRGQRKIRYKHATLSFQPENLDSPRHAVQSTWSLSLAAVVCLVFLAFVLLLPSMQSRSSDLDAPVLAYLLRAQTRPSTPSRWGVAEGFM